ncbi:hypothetical protein ABB37_09332 [Leptomonas pyrrhocoris]|uniref:EamA domain-containing protein n=1 Tax=Leptomonas pyrrhocoris TaxID=157538 RepID=A0A0N1J4B9_LEPPY|nr:hypothetical protein ABB37_09332 [Leptomonas pyrrhocoris]KPA74352.1 hypothetical protein ABB37_09332 [Leptomonas pyrrhocoris]|eukprot:XP_015652791.1 hypothetical protein ABB37_09332 [Leptomonas pyrrhocoris]
MPNARSPPSTESVTRDDPNADPPSRSASVITPAGPNRVRRAAAFLVSFVRLSKYGLGVVLILCVTVIWVASSEFIQYIFESLDFNKPFFLTYFNTTGFCLWNAGFLLSSQWRRTPWNEESRTQPVCIEDARLESKPDLEEEDEPTGGTEPASPEEIGGAPGVGHRTGLPPPSSPNRNASVNITLACAVVDGDVQGDEKLPPLNGGCCGAPGRKHHGSVSPPLRRNGAHGAHVAHTREPVSPSAPGPLLPPNASRGSFTSERHGGGGGPGNRLADNDDVDMRSELGEANGTVVMTQRCMADECRDYSLPSSSASSAREEVVTVVFTDEYDQYDERVANSRASRATLHGGGEGRLAQGIAEQQRDATRHSGVISPELLEQDPLEGPHPRRSHKRARQQRILRYSLRRIWTCALCFCPLWFLANYLFNLSLSITSVASNTVLSSTSSIWTLLLSYVMLRQRVGIHRIVAVAMCVSGSIMVGLADKDATGGNNTIGGDIAALLSAFFYAAYTSVLKWYLPDDERYSMGMVFGAVGALNFVFLWPGLPILSVTKAEPFAWPTGQQLWPLFVNALVGTNLSDVLWARSVVLTSPVVATLGLSLTTPLAMVVDAIFKHAHFNGIYISGAVLVMLGFLLANLPIEINLRV